MTWGRSFWRGNGRLLEGTAARRVGFSAPAQSNVMVQGSGGRRLTHDSACAYYACIFLCNEPPIKLQMHDASRPIDILVQFW